MRRILVEVRQNRAREEFGLLVVVDLETGCEFFRALDRMRAKKVQASLVVDLHDLTEYVQREAAYPCFIGELTATFMERAHAFFVGLNVAIIRHRMEVPETVEERESRCHAMGAERVSRCHRLG